MWITIIRVIMLVIMFIDQTNPNLYLLFPGSLSNVRKVNFGVLFRHCLDELRRVGVFQDIVSFLIVQFSIAFLSLLLYEALT